ncbi:protein DEHYDRATION-INDUCED 19 homolog 5 isoform X1 [Trifolium pratense]|uniref:protein DEHYDRATION-INDUCED 19 homolog 5 isoform X1 n=1 Tax=Trifolium pratense TaxID=57577 RepID=UPI001E69205E|nr:protein DEHYDRATION-INDUCED 19 homolog 5 isoform X1 [Trifolium pratense]
MEDETLSCTSSRTYQSHLELLIDFEDVHDDDDDELRTTYPCPFCEDDFELAELCCHIYLDHPIEAKSGICPVCAMWVGSNIVDHITAQHDNLFKSHHKSKYHKHDSYSTLPFSRKQRDGHWQSSSDELPPVMSTSKAACDPFLSFLYGAAASNEHENVQLDSSSGARIKEIHSDDTVLEERDVPPSISDKDQVEKARRSEFVQGLLMSTILDLEF